MQTRLVPACSSLCPHPLAPGRGQRCWQGGDTPRNRMEAPGGGFAPPYSPRVRALSSAPSPSAEPTGKGAQRDGDTLGTAQEPAEARDQPLAPSAGGRDTPNPCPRVLTGPTVPLVVLAAAVESLALGVTVALVLLAERLLAASLAGVGGRVQVFGDTNRGWPSGGAECGHPFTWSIPIPPSVPSWDSPGVLLQPWSHSGSLSPGSLLVGRGCHHPGVTPGNTLWVPPPNCSL